MKLFAFFRKKKPQLTEAQQKWNKIWELWQDEKAEAPYAQLMTYQSQINNGGHIQYFFNIENTGDLEQEMSVLETGLPEKLRANLKKAYGAWLVLREKEEDEKLEVLLEQCDDVFYENEALVNEALEAYASKLEL